MKLVTTKKKKSILDRNKRLERKKIKKARMVTDEATIVPMVTQGFPWFNKTEYNCEDSIYKDLYKIDRDQAERLKKSVLKYFPFNIRSNNIVSNGVY